MNRGLTRNTCQWVVVHGSVLGWWLAGCPFERQMPIGVVVASSVAFVASVTLVYPWSHNIGHKTFRSYGWRPRMTSRTSSMKAHSIEVALKGNIRKCPEPTSQ